MNTPLFIAIVILGAVFGVIGGQALGIKEIRQQAVKAGVAEWTSDAQGNPEFKWKTK